ncbi:hypothetical protein D3C86_2091280 [compost metagenome]
MPMGRETAQTSTSAAKEMASVEPMRDQMTSETGWFHSKEKPKSPRVRMPSIHLPYCTQTG